MSPALRMRQSPDTTTACLCPHHGHPVPTQSPLPTWATAALRWWVTHAARDLAEAYF